MINNLNVVAMKLLYSHNYKSKTIFPLIIGFLAYLSCEKLFEKYFPLPYSHDTDQGVILLMEYIIDFVLVIILIIIQYKYIVPKAGVSVIRLIKLAILFGTILSIFFTFLDRGPLPISIESFIEFFRFFVNIESFLLANLLSIRYLAKKIDGKHNELGD